MTEFTKLSRLGWDNFFENDFTKFSSIGFVPGRISRVNKNAYLVQCQKGEFNAEVSGKFHFNADAQSDFPAIGDWVAMREIPDENKAIIEHVLLRKNYFSRKVAGVKTDEQIIASNIDYLFIITSLNLDLNIRRIERYITLAIERDVKPVIILSKSDQCENVDAKISEVRSALSGVHVHAVSALFNTGIEEISEYFEVGKTVAVVGSSGVGKSTLINKLLGEDSLVVKEIGAHKDKGKHTTTHRELLSLPGGGMIIDTPGMREIQLWEGSEGINETFSDVEQYLGKCKFGDCRHESEPGCAIRKAIDEGELDNNRFRSYMKLQRELTWMENRKDKKAAHEQKKKWKKISAQVRRNQKNKSY